MTQYYAKGRAVLNAAGMYIPISLKCGADNFIEAVSRFTTFTEGFRAGCGQKMTIEIVADHPQEAIPGECVSLDSQYDINELNRKLEAHRASYNADKYPTEPGI